MGVERFDRAQRQQRAEAEGDVGGAPDFGADRVDRERQALAAERFRSRHRVPAGRGPALVGIGPAGRGGDLAAVELDAVLVADPVERRQHVGGESAGLFQHGRGDIAVEIAVMAGLHGGLQPGAVVEGEQHVVDRRAVGHGSRPRMGEDDCRLPTKRPFSQLFDPRQCGKGGLAGARRVRCRLRQARSDPAHGRAQVSTRFWPSAC